MLGLANSECIGYPHQVRQRPCAHLLHNISAMDLDRDFADSKLSRNLLVHRTRRDQADYLLFTEGQRFETSTRLQHRSFLHATVTIASERELNRIEKFLFTEWFGQKFHRARLHGTHCHRDIVVSAEENDWQMNIGLCKRRLKIEPTDTG